MFDYKLMFHYKLMFDFLDKLLNMDDECDTNRQLIEQHLGPDELMNFLHRWYQHTELARVPEPASPVRLNLGREETYYAEWITNPQWRHQCLVYDTNTI
jgi:hypothetical protein